jgi:hypothetical protein
LIDVLLLEQLSRRHTESLAAVPAHLLFHLVGVIRARRMECVGLPVALAVQRGYAALSGVVIRMSRPLCNAGARAFRRV